VNHSALISQS